MSRLAARVRACLFLVATEPVFIRTLGEAPPVTGVTVCLSRAPSSLTMIRVGNELQMLHELTLKVEIKEF